MSRKRIIRKFIAFTLVAFLAIDTCSLPAYAETAGSNHMDSVRSEEEQHADDNTGSLNDNETSDENSLSDEDGISGEDGIVNEDSEDENVTPAVPEDSRPQTSAEKENAGAPVTLSDVKYVRVNSSIGLNIRKGPGTEYSKIGVLDDNARVQYLGRSTASNGVVWYKVKCSFGTGYGSSDYLVFEEEKTPATDSSFESALDRENFPESYKAPLRKLHASYPNWRFKADYTGLTWDDAVYDETHPVNVNLVHSSAPDAWKSTRQGAYDIKNDRYISYDSGGWVPASSFLVKYYMDPRNFLNSNDIFQFMSSKYDSSTATTSNVAKVTKGTFMSGSFPEKVSGISTYNGLFVNRGKKYSMNPLMAASMIIQEQGRNGSGSCISGRVSGYKGYYNHFNVGAYAHSGRSAVTNGMIYAKNKGWNSRYKSISGGMQWFSDKYIKANQHTPYLKKFNVMNGRSAVATHQYMTNVAAGRDEGSHMASGYSSVKSSPLTFNIPVYKSMPSKACPKPGTSGNNINYLKSLSVSGRKISPSFSPYTSSYSLTVPSTTSSIKINATAAGKNAKISGAGTVSVPVGTKTFSVKVTSSSGLSRTYKITVKRPEPSPDARPDKVTGMKVKTDYGLIKVSYNRSDDSTIKSYRIAYREYNGTWKYINTTGTSYVIKDLKYNQKYQVRVAAVRDRDKNIRSYYCDSIYTYTNRVGTRSATPYTPRVEKLSTSNGSVTVTVRDIHYKTLPHDVYYKVRYRESGGSWHYLPYSSNHVQKASGLKKGTRYNFAVRYRYKSAIDNETYIYIDYSPYKSITVK